MTTLLPELPAPIAVLAVVPTAAGVVAAVVAGRASSATAAWRTARAATWLTMAAAAALAAAVAVGGAAAHALVRADAVTAVVLSLVAVLGWVVVRFSARYLAGDPLERRAASRFAATLAAVAAVVVANDLVLVGLAWMATSLSLHGLLTHAHDRPAAVAAAHKKFILARAADVCIVGAVVALVAAFGTTRLDEMAALVADAGALPATAQVGVALVALAAVVKSAQLPFHGWLIQVMEAPTPVSALLHAGVVNLGGLVLLRHAALVDGSVVAQALLVTSGGTTAVVAALVMTTRVSVKVALAWSTCAQMGIMLVQAGLGLWELALLHLVAHSLYKAHAFLRAGSTVRATMRHHLVAHGSPPRLGEIAGGVVLASGATAAAAAGWTSLPWAMPIPAAGWAFVGATALAVAPLTTELLRRPSRGLAVRIAALPIAALALHDVAARLAPKAPTPPLALVVVVAVLLAALLLAQTLLTAAPTAGPVARARSWLFRGLFLDEVFTRAAFYLWPPPAPIPRPVALASRSAIAATPAPADPPAATTRWPFDDLIGARS